MSSVNWVESGTYSDITYHKAEGIADLWWDAFDNGVFFWDTADSYGSHAAVKVALQKKVPREKVTIQTKVMARTAETLKADLERIRQEMGTDYIDIVLLHCLEKPSWEEEMRPYMDALADAKQKKQIRAVGVSCHNLGALKAAYADGRADADAKWREQCLTERRKWEAVLARRDTIDYDAEEAMGAMESLDAIMKLHPYDGADQ
jgi:diketogulonate reductase-like aldo/keto reductase